MKHCKSTLLNENFIMIYIILKISVLRTKVLNYIENSIFKCFLKKFTFQTLIIDFTFSIKNDLIFLKNYNDEKSRT